MVHVGELARIGLIRLGSVTPWRAATAIASISDAFLTAAWLRDAGLKREGKACRSRTDVFDALIAQLNDDGLLYLEFGVWRGESLGYWVEALPSASARFIGFDSFEGLPEDWTTQAPAGTFSTGGSVPEIDDPRVSYEIGWFEDTLGSFQLPEHKTLVVNVDSDLYSSATTILKSLEHAIDIGDFAYFDEFKHFNDERRAFAEHVSRSGYRYELIACDRRLQYVAFRRVA